METIFINKENIKTNEPHKFALNFSQRLDLRSSDKHVALHDLCICYMCENMRKQYKNNKPKIIDPTSDDKFELWLLFCFRHSRLYQIYC